MRRYQIALEQQFHKSVLEFHVQLLVGVGEVCDKSKIAIEMAWRVEVDDTEVCAVGVKKGRFWLDDEEDDQGGDSEEDYKEAEDQTDDGAAPDGWIRVAVPS